MGVNERRARDKEALRQKIVEAATHLFVTEGYESVSIRKIADQIEYAPSTIYLYFKDKADLLGTICRDTFEQLTELLVEVGNSQDPHIEKLRKGLRTYIEFGVNHPNHYLITFCLPQMPNPEPEVKQAFDAGLATFDTLRQEMRAAMQAGEIAPGDVEVISQTVWMFIHGVTSLLITNYGVCDFPFAPKEDLIETSLDLVLRSLRK